MLLIIHILAAGVSLFTAGYTFLFPSKRWLNITYGLVATTLLSGTALVITRPTHLGQLCLTGLAYVGVIILSTVLIRHKLALQNS